MIWIIGDTNKMLIVSAIKIWRVSLVDGGNNVPSHRLSLGCRLHSHVCLHCPSGI